MLSIISNFLNGYQGLTGLFVDIIGIDFSSVFVLVATFSLFVNTSKTVYAGALDARLWCCASSVTIPSNDQLFLVLLRWFRQRPTLSDRRLRAGLGNDTWRSSRPDHDAIYEIYYEPDYGRRWFRHDGYLFLMVFSRKLQAASHNAHAYQSEEIQLYCFGWSTSLIKRLLDTVYRWDRRETSSLTTVRTRNPSKVATYKGPWADPLRRPTRPLESVVFDEQESVCRSMREFLNAEEWYAKRGIPYQQGYLLAGPPGTGKTSSVLALAGYFGLPVYVLNLGDSDLTDHELRDCIAHLPKHCILLVEDVDASGLDCRKNPDQGKKQTQITLSSFLNVLDGVAAHHGRILMLTTNHAEHLDSALKRPGRIDYEVTFGLASKDHARALFQHFFGESAEHGALNCADLQTIATDFATAIPEGTFAHCEIQKWLIEHQSSPQNAAKVVNDLVTASIKAKQLTEHVAPTAKNKYTRIDST